MRVLAFVVQAGTFHLFYLSLLFIIIIIILFLNIKFKK
jgi:hypothetical protein